MEAPEGDPEEVRLDGLVTLVEACEQAHFPVAPPDPIAAIVFMMEQ